MSDFSALDQRNWYAPASLVIQLAFLIAGTWFARNLLRSMNASQEQMGALLKLSITGMTGERHLSNVGMTRSLTEGSPYCIVPSETEGAGLPEPVASSPSPFAVARGSVVLWLQAPMSSAETAPWRRVINWLQAPTGS